MQDGVWGNEPGERIGYCIVIAVAAYGILMIAVAQALPLPVAGWFLVCGILLVVIPLCVITVQAYLKARGVVWTDEKKKEYRRRQIRTLMTWAPLVAAQIVTNWLERNNMIPPWLGAPLDLVLLVALFAALFGLGPFRRTGMHF